MPNFLTMKPDEIDSAEKRSKIVVSVVGCGRKGTLFAYSFAQAGFKVFCLDTDPNVIRRLARGKTLFSEQEIEGKLKSLIRGEQLNVTGEIKKALSRSDVVIVAVPPKVDEKKKSDFSEAVGILKQVGASLRTGMLVIYGEVASFGFMEGVAKETLENTSGLKAGQDFVLAYIPIHNSQVKQLNDPATNLELKVAVYGKSGQDATLNLAKTMATSVKQLNDFKTAEINALFTAAKRDVNAALAVELAVFCENTDVDYFEVSKSSELNDPSFWPKVDDEENRNEAYLLLEAAENLNVKLKVPEMARQINEEMVKHAFTLTQDALRNCNKTLRRATIAVLGRVASGSQSEIYVKLLSLKGAKTSLYDPTSKREPSETAVKKTSLNEAVEGTDIVVFLTGEEQFKSLNLRKLKAMMKTPSVILDLAGAFERSAVEAEGFIYRGLGRGTG